MSLQTKDNTQALTYAKTLPRRRTCNSVLRYQLARLQGRASIHRCPVLITIAVQRDVGKMRNHSPQLRDLRRMFRNMPHLMGARIRVAVAARRGVRLPSTTAVPRLRARRTLLTS
jgi:hypothetical protein